MESTVARTRNLTVRTLLTGATPEASGDMNQRASMSTPGNTAVITSSHTKGARFLHGTHTSSQEGMSFLQQRHTASTPTAGIRNGGYLCQHSEACVPALSTACTARVTGIWFSVGHLLDADDHSLDSCQVRGQQVGWL
jgi:hypothetical protein